MHISFLNCYFKSTLSDININASGIYYNYRIFLDNCKTVSPTIITSSLVFNKHSYIKTKNLNGLTGSFKTWTSYGTIESDSSIKRLNTSVKVTPSTSYKNTTTNFYQFSSTASNIYIESSRKVVPVLKNTYVNVSVWIRKSKTSDGANYNGLQPRLLVGANSYLGVTYDTVLATATSHNGVFEKVTATFYSPNDGVAEFWIECNGNTGWINIDDWIINRV